MITWTKFIDVNDSVATWAVRDVASNLTYVEHGSMSVER